MLLLERMLGVVVEADDEAGEHVDAVPAAERSGEAQETAMVVHLVGGALVEPLGDPAHAIRVAGQEDERRVVAFLGAEVDL